MSKKKNNRSIKVAFVIAGSLALIGMTNGANLNQANSQHLSNENSIQIPSNQQLKPQLIIKPNFESPVASLAYIDTLHSSHYSSLMWRGESLSGANKKIVHDILKTFPFYA